MIHDRLYLSTRLQNDAQCLNTVTVPAVVWFTLQKPKYRLFPQNFHVVQLNVGGHLYATTLSTLRKHPDSKLAEIFSGPPKLRADAQGRYFIDRDGSHFGAILEFLRSEQLPKENIQEVRLITM